MNFLIGNLVSSVGSETHAESIRGRGTQIPIANCCKNELAPGCSFKILGQGLYTPSKSDSHLESLAPFGNINPTEGDCQFGPGRLQPQPGFFVLHEPVSRQKPKRDKFPTRTTVSAAVVKNRQKGEVETR